MSETVKEVIPVSDPKASYLAHREEIDAAVARVLASGQYILGPEVHAFEEEFASYLRAAHTIGVANGTDAIRLALAASGVQSRDRVITVSHTAVATVAAIELAGARPLLVDIDPSAFTISPHSILEAISQFEGDRRKEIKAIVAVHLYGRPAPMRSVMEIAENLQIRVIEDCGQSHGASLDGKMTGTWGHAAAFSFYPTKNLGAFGDGGAVATHDGETAKRVRQLRQYGWGQRYVSNIAGMNSRLDELQAATLRVKLKYLDEENRRRIAIAARYDSALRGTRIMTPERQREVQHVYHQYVIRTDRRDELMNHLTMRGISTAIHYPTPVHLQPAYDDSSYRGSSLDNTEKVASEIVSLPIHPHMSDQQLDRVIEGLLTWNELPQRND